MPPLALPACVRAQVTGADVREALRLFKVSTMAAATAGAGGLQDMTSMASGGWALMHEFLVLMTLVCAVYHSMYYGITLWLQVGADDAQVP